MFSSSLKGPTSHDQMNMNQNKFRYCTSLAYHPKIHWNAVNNIYLNQNVLGVDLQLCLCFTECNQCCPFPVGPTVGRLWAPKTNRMQSTTWVQRQINSNSLISEPPNVCSCVHGKISVTPDKISLQGFLKSWQLCQKVSLRCQNSSAKITQNLLFMAAGQLQTIICVQNINNVLD